MCVCVCVCVCLWHVDVCVFLLRSSLLALTGAKVGGLRSEYKLTISQLTELIVTSI